MAKPQTSTNNPDYPYSVYAGSERVDLGPKGEPQVLCKSLAQAMHMMKFWPGAGYVEGPLDVNSTDDSVLAP